VRPWCGWKVSYGARVSGRVVSTQGFGYDPVFLPEIMIRHLGDDAAGRKLLDGPDGWNRACHTGAGICPVE